MNIPALINKYNGDTLSYDGIPANAGQCVQWVEYVLTDNQYGYGLAPFWGNAIDWWNNFSGSLTGNFDKIPISQDKPKAGDIVIWGSGVGSIYGHIDLCTEDWNGTSFVGYDSNWGGNKTVHQVTHNLNAVVGMLRPKGQPTNTMDRDTVTYAYRLGWNREPNAQEYGYWVGRSAGELLYAIYFSNNDFRYAAIHYQEEVDKNKTLTAQVDDLQNQVKGLPALQSQVSDLSAQITSLKAALAKDDAQIKDPNKIIITDTGWKALWAAIQSFFAKNN